MIFTRRKFYLFIRKIFLSALLCIAFFSFFPTTAIAQKVEIEQCQKYYQFGEVKVNLNTKKPTYSPGENIELLGTVVNENSFPLLNITILAQLKRINEETLLGNGHFLIDRLVLARDLNFLPKETKTLSAVFEVKNNYPQGKYQLQYSVFSKEGFYYSGRPFLEEDFAGVTNFQITNSQASLVFFDVGSLSLAGVSQRIRDYIPVFDPGENPLIEVKLQDTRSEKSDLLGMYKWYRWDDSFEENLVKTGRIHFFANQPSIFKTVFDLTEPGAYVLYLELNDPTRSAFKFRIARRGEKALNLRMNDLGITNYPADPAKDHAFVCFHSPAEENAPLTKVSLSLFDAQDQVLETKSVEDSFTGEVMAISIPLTKLSDPLNFAIEGDFQDLENPALSRKVRLVFSPDLFGKSPVDLNVSYNPKAVGGPKLSLGAVNVVGEVIPDAPLERLVIYQNGQIKDEQYNLAAIPAEYDLSNFPSGDYKLLVKSGSIQKEMEFSVGEIKEPKSPEPVAKKRYWWLIILGALFFVSLISFVIIKKRRKERLGGERQ